MMEISVAMPQPGSGSIGLGDGRAEDGACEELLVARKRRGNTAVE